MKKTLAILSLLLMAACTTSYDAARSGSDSSSSGDIDAPVLSSEGPSQDPQVNYRNVQDPPPARALHQAANEAWKRGDRRGAKTQWVAYLRQYPAGQFADQAHLNIAEEARDRYDHKSALASYEAVVALSPPSRLRGEALYGRAQSERATGQGAKALGTLAQINFAEVQAAKRPEVFVFWSETAAEQGRWLEATLASLKAYWDSKGGTLRSKAESSARAQIENRLGEANLEFVLKEYPNRFPANEVRLRLTSLYIARGDSGQAQKALNLVLLSAVQGSAVHQRALQLQRQLQGRLQSMGQVQGGRIGLLLPLSGARAPLGQAVLNGFRLGVLKSGTKIEVVTADPGPTPETARRAFERLIFEEKVIAVVGPLSGREAEIVATLSVEYGVPNINLSARSGLLDKGPFVFRSALTPEKQVRSLVRYAREHHNAKTFAVLFPEDSFGEAYAKEYFDAVRRAGGEVTAAESYPPDATDFKVPLENMVAKAFPHFRRAEAAELAEAERLRLGRDLTSREKNALRLPPIVDFDVLFIPDTYKALGQIVPALLYQDVTQPLLLGPATWRNHRLLDRAGQYLNRAYFVDFYASARDDAVTRDFSELYQVKNGHEPSPMAALGYDIGLALQKIYASGSQPDSREELRARLENLGEVKGALGRHEWDAERDSLAELQLFRVRRGSFEHQGGIPAR